MDESKTIEVPKPEARECYVSAEDAFTFARRLRQRPESVDLVLMDPPYFKILPESWDNQWRDVDDYVAWFVGLLYELRPALKPNGSVLFFGGIGHHGCRPFQRVCLRIEELTDPRRGPSDLGLYARNLLTWKKRRGFGKSHDYLFCREEIAWYSASPERTAVNFNVPYLNEKRGYEGWNKDYPAKSEFKRVSNVFADIGEIMRPERTCQKPIELLSRLIETHSNPGDLVVDPFSGWGSTGVAAVSLGRDFAGCERIEADAVAADARVCEAYNRRWFGG